MKRRHTILTLISIYGMGDVPVFMMGDGMGDAPAFVIKGDVPQETRVSFTCIIKDVQHKCTSPFCQRSGRVSDINLTETCRKAARLLFTLHRASSAPW
jgi:hypothetical protein